MAEKAVLVQVQLPDTRVDPVDPFRELRALAATAGAEVVGELIQKRQRPRGSTYLGKGKVEELLGLIQLAQATIVIFDNDLVPRQIGALEKELECKIIDRSELILDIFANRATTHAAKLQVEIAQLEYTLPRLRAMWDHLGQIVGGAPVGIGTRGPGEQQLEIDRRIARRRLQQLQRQLEDIQARKQREVDQRNVDHFTVGLVGYTNAGKSTLFNRLTSGGAFAHEKLFATLSTRVERWDLGGGNAVMLSDTVGFIRDLPHHLVASFKSTLEETVNAQLIVVVLDVSDPSVESQLDTVELTLAEIGAAHQPQIIALNKTDQLQDRADLLVWLNRHPDAIPISARRGEGLDELASRVRDALLGGVRCVEIRLSMKQSRAVDFLEKRTEVLDRRYVDGEVIITSRIGRRHVDQLLAQGTSFTIDGLPPRDALERRWSAEHAGSHEPDDESVPPHERYWQGRA
ncbi:MAG: GTPase HflX [Planctomycetota bacterium]